MCLIEITHVDKRYEVLIKFWVSELTLWLRKDRVSSYVMITEVQERFNRDLLDGGWLSGLDVVLELQEVSLVLCKPPERECTQKSAFTASLQPYTIRYTVKRHTVSPRMFSGVTIRSTAFDTIHMENLCQLLHGSQVSPSLTSFPLSFLSLRGSR